MTKKKKKTKDSAINKQKLILIKNITHICFKFYVQLCLRQELIHTLIIYRLNVEKKKLMNNKILLSCRPSGISKSQKLKLPKLSILVYTNYLLEIENDVTKFTKYFFIY